MPGVFLIDVDLNKAKEKINKKMHLITIQYQIQNLDSGADTAGEGDPYNSFQVRLSIGGPPDDDLEGENADEKAAAAAVASLALEEKGGASASASASAAAPSAAAAITQPKASISAPAPALVPKPAAKGEAFTQKLDAKALAYFTEVAQKPFSEQAIAFLNAYWKEVGTQAEFIFSVAYETIKYADMHAKGIMFIHLYDEGCDLDFNIGLYFYEKLCKKVLEDPEGKAWRENPKYAASLPEMLTALVRKQELREKVDANFDGRISFLEYLLYQYRSYANPADFVERSMGKVTDSPDILKAKAMLEDVNKAIRAYESEKQRLTEEAKLPGVKGTTAKHQLTILINSPLAEQLSTALIKAEAAVRIAGRYVYFYSLLLLLISIGFVIHILTITK